MQVGDVASVCDGNDGNILNIVELARIRRTKGDLEHLQACKGAGAWLKALQFWTAGCKREGGSKPTAHGFVHSVRL